MTLTKEVQNQLFSADSNRLVCLPTRTTYALPVAIAPAGSVGPAGTVAMANSNSPSSASNNGISWTDDEHARFLLGLEMFPSGPWKAIASIVGTRTARQTMSHAQKYRQKIARRQRGGQQQQEPLATPLNSASASNSNQSSPVATLMTESLADLHLSSEQIDEIIQSLFEDDDGSAGDDDAIVITSEDMEAIVSTHQ